MNIKLPKVLKNFIQQAEEPQIPMPTLPVDCLGPEEDAFTDVDDAAYSYGVASVNISSKDYQRVEMTKSQFARSLKIFLGYDKYAISSNEAIFANLDKVDLSNAQVHLKNMKTWLSGDSNHKEKTMQNGYFSSDDGALAFKLLAEKLDSNAEAWRVSPLSIALADLTSQTVLKLH